MLSPFFSVEPVKEETNLHFHIQQYKTVDNSTMLLYTVCIAGGQTL